MTDQDQNQYRGKYWPGNPQPRPEAPKPLSELNKEIYENMTPVAQKRLLDRMIKSFLYHMDQRWITIRSIDDLSMEE